jgi:hypothetical protein
MAVCKSELVCWGVALVVQGGVGLVEVVVVDPDVLELEDVVGVMPALDW